MSAAVLPAAVRRYLTDLERTLKSQAGPVPEDALSDAREFLMEDAAALERSGEALDDDQLYEHFLATFGDPRDVAEQYASQAGPVPQRAGFAPGWRICCTRCGRSAPLAAVGGLRVGARSAHKYTVGWCRDCGGLRFLRITQDLDRSNLTEALDVSRLPDEVRANLHRPWRTIASILLATALIILAVWLAMASLARGDEPASAANREAVKRLQMAVARNYSHRDRREIDWPARLATFEPKLLSAADADRFGNVTAEFLSEAQDVHIWLKVKDKTIPTHALDLRPNFNPRLLPRLIPQLRQHGKTVLTGTFPDGLRYVAIATWDHREPASMEAAIAWIKEAAEAKAPLIIDVRPNTGGDERQAQRVAAFFVKQETPFAQHVTIRDGVDQPAQRRSVQPNADGVFHPGPCLVLMGPANISSCESYLLMMRAAGHRLVGAPSPGASGNPQPHDLGNGVTVYLPSWRNQTLDGKPLEGHGVQPDVLVDAKLAEFATNDPVLKRSLDLLRKMP